MSESSGGAPFVWYDLMASDVDAAKSFYTELIGWTLTPFEGSPVPYDMWTADEPLGGVMQLPEEVAAMGAPPHWIGYVGTKDVDATVARAAGLGGTVLKPAEDIPNVGRFAVLQDPQGAAFCVFSGSDPDWQPPAGPPKDKTVSWHELATTDWEGAWGFYSELFGWKHADDMDMGEGNMYRMFGSAPEQPMGGMFNKPPEMPMPAWLYYIKVPNMDSAVDKVKELGGQILNGPMEVPGGDRVAQCMDNNGAAFALHASA